MKRLISVMLMVSALLSACGDGEPPPPCTEVINEFYAQGCVLERGSSSLFWGTPETHTSVYALSHQKAVVACHLWQLGAYTSPDPDCRFTFDSLLWEMAASSAATCEEINRTIGRLLSCGGE